MNTGVIIAVVIVIVIVVWYTYSTLTSAGESVEPTPGAPTPATKSTVTFYSKENLEGEAKTLEFIPGVKYPISNATCGYADFRIGFKPLSFKLNNVKDIKKYNLSITGDNVGNKKNTVVPECGVVTSGTVNISIDNYINLRTLFGAAKYDIANGAIFFDYIDMIY